MIEVNYFDFIVPLFKNKRLKETKFIQMSNTLGTYHWGYYYKFDFKQFRK